MLKIFSMYFFTLLLVSMIPTAFQTFCPGYILAMNDFLEDVFDTGSVPFTPFQNRLYAFQRFFRDVFGTYIFIRQVECIMHQRNLFSGEAYFPGNPLTSLTASQIL